MGAASYRCGIQGEEKGSRFDLGSEGVYIQVDE